MNQTMFTQSVIMKYTCMRDTTSSLGETARDRHHTALERSLAMAYSLSMSVSVNTQIALHQVIV